MILFDYPKQEDVPVRLNKRETCPTIDNTTLFAGCMVVASSALLIMINLGGGVGL